MIMEVTSHECAQYIKDLKLFKMHDVIHIVVSNLNIFIACSFTDWPKRIAET